jgi:hypothetical protein
MSTPIITPVPNSTATPYLTVAELKRSPIYTQLQKLIPGAADKDNDAELAAIIRRVSAMINGECRQNLAATVDSEADWMTTSDYGELRIHTRANPIVQVLSISVGPDPCRLAPLADLTGLVVGPWRITVPAHSLGGLGGFGRRRRMWVQWSYINGYPVTALASPTAAGDAEVTVTDATGIVPNRTVLTVFDGRFLESIAPTAVDGNTLTVAPLASPHLAGVGVSALPDDIQEAALILISRLHNTWSLSMGAITHDGTGARKNPNAPGIGTRFLCDPAVILEPYKRVW